MLTLNSRIESERHDAELVLPFELREKSRLRATLVSGEEVILMLPRGSVLRGGELLVGDDGRVVRVVAAPEATYRIECNSATAFARCAYHLGNRHTAVEIVETPSDHYVLRILADTVLKGMLEGLGAQVTSEQTPFEPEAGAYAAGHHHHSMEAKHSGVIHEYRQLKHR